DGVFRFSGLTPGWCAVTPDPRDFFADAERTRTTRRTYSVFDRQLPGKNVAGEGRVEFDANDDRLRVFASAAHPVLDADLYVVRPGEITGRVLDARGIALPDATVRLLWEEGPRRMTIGKAAW